VANEIGVDRGGLRLVDVGQQAVQFGDQWCQLGGVGIARHQVGDVGGDRQQERAAVQGLLAGAAPGAAYGNRTASTGAWRRTSAQHSTPYPSWRSGSTIRRR